MTDPSPADTGADSSRWQCENCGGQHDHDTEFCCSSHNRRICHRCYRKTHFVDFCACPRCMKPSPASTPDERPEPYTAPTEELHVIQRAMYLLTDLDDAAQRRALIWLCSRLLGVSWDDLERVL